MKKTKKLISLICTLCMVCTIVALPGIGITGYAAVTDVASLIKSSADPKGMWKSGTCTLTGNGTSSVTATGTSTGSMTAYPAFSFDTKTIGSGTDTILHLSYTISNPNGHRIDLRYQDSKGRYDLLKDFSAFIDPTSYQVDWFLNLIDRSYRLYFDNKLHTEGSIQSAATTIKNLYLDMPVSGEFTFTINDPKQEIYGAGATMNDVVAHTFKSRSNSNYYWTVNGIGNIGGTVGSRLVGNTSSRNGGSGAVDGANYVITASSSNENSGVGYRLRMLNSNGTNTTKGCLPQDSENDNIIHQSLTITPNLSSGNTAAVGFRGNNSYQTEKYKFGDKNGYESGKEYHFDILVNNKDKEYYILVDGEKRATGKTGNGYLAEFVYTIANAGSDTLYLSNIVTTSYDYTVSMDDILDTLVKSSNYNWSFDGVDLTSTSIASGYSTPSNYVSVSCTNAGGYTLSATNDGARFGYRLGNGNKAALERDTTQDNIIHQHLSFTPTFAPGNTEQIGIRGNEGYHDLFTVSAEKGFTSGKEYDMHIIINNKNFSYYFIVDGAIKGSGTIAAARSPLWEISYKINSNGDSMLLKNISTKYYDNTVSVYSLTSTYATSNEAFMDYRFITDSNGYLAAELEQADCYNTDKWKINTSKRFFSGDKALAPKAQNTSGIESDPAITLNLSFTANKPGTNTYYLWVRHTASVLNEDGRNFFMAIDTSGTTTPTLTSYTAEEKAPRWMLLGSVTVAEEETGYVYIRERQASHVAWDKYVITTDSSYVPTDSAFGITPPSSSRAKNMGTLSGGRLYFEAEKAGYGGNFELLDNYLDGNTYGWYNEYSDNKALMISSGSSTPTNWNDSTESITAGDIEFNFTPDNSGSVYLWTRYYATSTNKKFAVSVNSNDYSTVVMDEADTKAWQMIAAIDNVTAGMPVNVRIANVVGGYAIDMFAVSSNIFDTPSGSTPNWSTQSTTLTGGSPTITVANLPSHPRLYFTSDEISSIASADDLSQNSYMKGQNDTYISKGLRSEFTGEVAGSPGYPNYSDKAITRIEAMAYDYAINGNSASGAKAVTSMINYITNVSYTGLESDQLTRKAGYDLYTLSKVYDWCYALLSSEQKTAFINAGIKIASQIATDWPPSATATVTGFGSEGAFQSYLLAFAIAVANERPDIYNYVMDTVENSYVPANIKVYSGISMQGSRYGTYRGQHVFSSALMLKTIGYENTDLYKALANTMMQYIYARRPDGLLFTDGDDTNNGKTPYSYYSVGHMRNMFLHAIKLFGNEYGVGSDSYFKDAAKWACYSSSGQFSKFDDTFGQEGYITPSTFLILNGNQNLGAKETYSLPLSKYFGGGISSMIARTSWSEFTKSNIGSLDKNDNSAVAYMKIGTNNAGNHQHLDAGNFQLYYKGLLANDPCYYSGSNYSSSYMNGYAKRSVAHNVVLVKDGKSNTVGDISYADGGQKPVNDASTLSQITNTASVEAHAIVGEDVNQPEFTYLKGNLKKAYSDSVNNYKRSFMFMNMYDDDEPASLIVYDRLVTTNSSYPTGWLLHGLSSPSVSGKRAVFTTSTGGQMTNDTLLPASVSINTYADGYVDSSHSYSSGYTSETGKVNESDGYRIEVTPSSQTTTTYFLNVIQTGDTGTSAITPTLISSDNFYGVRLKDRVVLFSKTETWFGETKEQEYYFNFSSNDGYVYKIAMADAYTGSYEIYYSADGTGYSLLSYAKTLDDSSHLITFSGKAGYYKVVRKSNTTGGTETSFTETDTLKMLSPGVKIRQSGANYIISASPKTYRSYAKPDSNTYNNKLVLAAYDEASKSLLGYRVIPFTATSKESAYVDIVTLSSAPTGKITVKCFILDNFNSITPLTASKKLQIVN